MTAEQDSEVLGRDPRQVTDPVDRARLVFTQWHFDAEAEVGVPEASTYAQRLINELEAVGLTFCEFRNDES